MVLIDFTTATATTATTTTTTTRGNSIGREKLSELMQSDLVIYDDESVDEATVECEHDVPREVAFVFENIWSPEEDSDEEEETMESVDETEEVWEDNLESNNSDNDEDEGKDHFGFTPSPTVHQPAHELYFPVGESFTNTIHFSDDMTPEECDDYYRNLAAEEAASTLLGTNGVRRRMGMLRAASASPSSSVVSSTHKNKKSLSRRDSLQTEATTSLSSISTSDSDGSEKSGVSFSHDVIVHPVHHFAMYPFEVRSKVWSTRSEIAANKRRNKLEYRYDMNDWRNATEERDMIYDVMTSSYVHPVHFDQF